MLSRPISGSGGVSTGLYRVINVKDYGAAGNGVTDDTIAIGTAIAALGTYRRLFFPAGTYIISAELVIGVANITVFGEGKDASIIKLISGASGITQMMGVTASGVTIESLGLDGNSVNNSTINVSGIKASANEFQLLDSKIQKITWYGVSVDGGTAGLNFFRLVNNHISDIGFRGIAIIHAKDGLISGNIVVSTGSHALDIQRGSVPGTYNCERLRVIGNYATRATPPVVLTPSMGVQDGGLLALDLGAKYITVDGNILWDNRTGGDDGIILGQDGTNDPTDIVITNNTVGYAGNFGIDATTRSVVDGNYVYKAGAYGIVAVIDIGGSHADAIISNNLVIDPMNDGNVGYSGGIVAYSLIAGATIKNLKVTSNTIKSSNNLCANGVHLVSGNAAFTDVEVTGNNLKTVLTKSVETTGTDFTNLIVKDNLEKTPFRTFTNADTTPSVLAGEIFKCSNTAATTVTAFDNGYTGQEIEVIFTNSNTTINETGNIKLQGVDAVNPAADDVYRFRFDGTSWFQMGGGAGGNDVDGGIAGESDTGGQTVDGGSL